MQKTQQVYQNANLNNLPFLAAVIEYGSITRAGVALGLSQPAASRIMAQLRKQIGDPLLVRTRQGYQLTDYARTLSPSVQSAMCLTQDVFKAKEFVPETDIRSLQLATTDYGILTVMLGVDQKIRSQAPRLSVNCQSWSADTLSQLEQGHIDMALFDDGELPLDFHRQFLFKETYHLVCRSGHPLTSQPNLEAILTHVCGYPRVTVSYPTGQFFAYDDVLKRAGVGEPPAHMSMPYFQSALWLLPNSDAVMAVPSRIYELFKQQLNLIGWPLQDLKEDFDYYLIWHHRSQSDPFHAWFRQQIKTLALGGPGS
jgi:DNA-binding transcriptional LysR family regulator